jgi:pyruvate dehydrogenase E2 component (dihydrolipoamide acetyltransferase)
MPEVAAGTEEATLSAWNVTENQPYSAADVIAVVETAKAAIDIEAPGEGRIVRILVPEGTDVAVGDAIAVLASRDEQVDDIDATLLSLGIGSGTAQPTEITERSVQSASPSAGRVFASPLARRLAREAGIDYEVLCGTGPHGRIRRSDVEAAIAQRDALAAQAVTAPTDTTPAAPESQQPAQPTAAELSSWTDADAASDHVPHSKLRRAIAQRLTQSKATTPHFYLRGSGHVDSLLALREQLNKVSPVKISVNDLVVKAVATAYQQVPAANVVWDESGMRRFGDVDLGVAVATNGGLVTPVIRGVQRLTLGQVAAQIRNVAERAREGRLKQHELEGGTATISNLGMYGTEEFAAIINPPQSAILAVGAARPEPVIVDGRVAAATVLRVTLSVDHRAIDGALAAKWMQAFVAIISNPLVLLI